MLALAFLVLIGVALVADGFDFHIPRGYIYFAMAFAAAVEIVQHPGGAGVAARGLRIFGVADMVAIETSLRVPGRVKWLRQFACTISAGPKF